MRQKHRRALKVALLVSVLGMIPILVLAMYYRDNLILDVAEFGVVPEFEMLFSNNPRGMSHADTELHGTVVALVPQPCASGCPGLMAQMQTVKSYYDEQLRGKLGDPNTPRPLRFVVQSRQTLDWPEGWDQAIMDEQTPWLRPNVKDGAAAPAFVLIDDSSFYRGYIPSSDPLWYEKISRELNRMASSQFLMHYVTRQTLMWNKVKGRDIKLK